VNYIDLPVYRRGKGVIAWAKISRRDYARVSKFRWYLDGYGYARRVWYVGGKQASVRLHVEILGKRAGLVIDHFNGDKLDCTRRNLRFVGRMENRQNTSVVRSDSQSGVKGVYWHTQNQCWVAYSKLQGRKIHLGCFDVLEDAGDAVREFRLKNLSINEAFA
jgi:hypothetical protein